MATPLLGVELIDELAVVVLDNPPVNALRTEIHEEMLVICGDLAASGTVAAVVFTATGDRAFSAGADISGLPSAPPTPEQLRRALELECAAFDSIANLPQPTVAAIFGHTLGGGLELSVSCDFRVAADNLQAGLPEATIGYFPASGSLVRLAHLIGSARTKRMAMLCESLDAGEALRIGLVDEVVQAGRERERAIELARVLAGQGASAIRAIKRIIDADESRFHAEDIALILELAAGLAEPAGEPAG